MRKRGRTSKIMNEVTEQLKSRKLEKGDLGRRRKQPHKPSWAHQSREEPKGNHKASHAVLGTLSVLAAGKANSSCKS
jgi:hypothetical protein